MPLSYIKQTNFVARKMRYKDSLDASLKTLQIDTSTWENAALDRPKWRSEITMNATPAEKRRMAEAEEERRKRKDLTAIQPPNTSTHVLHICNRLYRDRIGLIRHLRTHRNQTQMSICDESGPHRLRWTNEDKAYLFNISLFCSLL